MWNVHDARESKAAEWHGMGRTVAIGCYAPRFIAAMTSLGTSERV